MPDLYPQGSTIRLARPLVPLALWILSAFLDHLGHHCVMFMELDPLDFPEVMSTASMPRAKVRDLEKRGFWHPLRGFLAEPFPSDAVSAGHWRSREHLHQAQIRALVEHDPSDTVFAATTAAWLLGHPIWPATHDVYVYKARGMRSARILPQYGDMDPLVLRRMKAVPALDSVLEVHGGIPVTNLERTAVDVARLAASETALIAVSSILGRLACVGSNYDARKRPAEYVERESRIRARMLEIVEALPRVSGRARARQVIEMAEGRLESVGEARVLRLLHAFGLPIPELQQRFVIDGQEFFADFTWPELRAILEFNGEGKYGSGDERGRRVANERARESLLRNQGYRILNVSWQQLNGQRSLARTIDQFLKGERRESDGFGFRTYEAPSRVEELDRDARPVRRDFGIGKP